MVAFRGRGHWREGKGRYYGSWSNQAEDALDLPVGRQHAARGHHSRFAIREGFIGRRVWNWILLSMLVYTGTIFPYRLAFIEFHVPEALPSPEEWGTLEAIIDALFWVDLFAGFFFTFTDSNDEEVFDLQRIAKKYLRGYFAINLISCLPPEAMKLIVDIIIAQTSDESTMSKAPRLSRIQRVSRLYKLIRLPRLAKLAEMSKKDNAILGWMRKKRGMRVANFVVGLCWVVHILGCGWYLVASLHVDVMETWLNRRVASDLSGQTLLDRNAPATQWIHSVYFVLTIFTTVGFGDISPVTEAEITYVCLSMIVGCVVNSLVVSEMINVLTGIDGRKALMKERGKLVQSFAKQFELKDDVTAALERGVKLGKLDKYQQLAEHDSQAILSMMLSCGLSRQLLNNVTTSLHRGRLFKNQFLRTLRIREQQVAPRFALRLALMLEMEMYNTKEYVYCGMDHPYSIFLALSGIFAAVGRPGPDGGASELKLPGATLSSISIGYPHEHEVVQDRELAAKGFQLYPYKLYGGGSYFGDIEVVLEMKHRLTGIRCERQGEVLSLENSNFIQLVSEYPRYGAVWRAAAQAREGHRRVMLSRLKHAVNYHQLAAEVLQSWVRSHVLSTRSSGPSRGHNRAGTSDMYKMVAMIENCAIEQRAKQDQVGRNLGSSASGSNVTRSDFQQLENRLQSLQRMMTFMSAAPGVTSETGGAVMHASSVGSGVEVGNLDDFAGAVSASSAYNQDAMEGPNPDQDVRVDAEETFESYDI